MADVAPLRALRYTSIVRPVTRYVRRARARRSAAVAGTARSVPEFVRQRGGLGPFVAGVAVAEEAKTRGVASAAFAGFALGVTGIYPIDS
jgi:hypothetical protein